MYGSFLWVIGLLIFVWLGAVSFLLLRVIRTFSRLTKGVSDKDLKNLLDELLAELKKEKLLTEELNKKIEELKAEGLSHIKKVGLIRYNPFSDTGGNQSFVLTILDSQDNGFVLTSLHSRGATRVFAKPVSEGKESGFEFSKEEIQAIMEAKKGRKIEKTVKK